MSMLVSPALIAALLSVGMTEMERGPEGHVGPACPSGSLSSSPIDVQEASGSIDILATGLDSLRLVSGTQFSGPCASSVRAIVMDQVQMIDGSVLARNASPPFAYESQNSRRAFEDAYDTRTAAEKMLPKLGGTSPLDSERVNAKISGGNFVGVWQIGDEWLVAAFVQRADRSFTTPSPILRSKLRVRSVQYFPSPDTPSGVLYVLQEQPDTRTRVLTLSWFHREIFTGHDQ